MKKLLTLSVLSIAIFSGQVFAQDWLPYRHFELRQFGTNRKFGEIYVEILSTGFPNLRAFVRLNTDDKPTPENQRGYQLDIHSVRWDGNNPTVIRTEFQPSKHEETRNTSPFEVIFGSADFAEFVWDGEKPMYQQVVDLPLNHEGEVVTSAQMLEQMNVRDVESKIVTPKWRGGTPGKNLEVIAGVPDGEGRLFGETPHVLVAANPNNYQQPEVLVVVPGKSMFKITPTSVTTLFDPHNEDAKIVTIDGFKIDGNRKQKMRLYSYTDDVLLDTWPNPEGKGHPLSVHLVRDRTITDYNVARAKLKLRTISGRSAGVRDEKDARKIKERIRKLKHGAER